MNRIEVLTDMQHDEENLCLDLTVQYHLAHPRVTVLRSVKAVYNRVSLIARPSVELLQEVRFYGTRVIDTNIIMALECDDMAESECLQPGAKCKCCGSKDELCYFEPTLKSIGQWRATEFVALHESQVIRPLDILCQNCAAHASVMTQQLLMGLARAIDPYPRPEGVVFTPHTNKPLPQAIGERETVAGNSGYCNLLTIILTLLVVALLGCIVFMARDAELVDVQMVELTAYITKLSMTLTEIDDMLDTLGLITNVSMTQTTPKIEVHIRNPFLRILQTVICWLVYQLDRYLDPMQKWVIAHLPDEEFFHALRVVGRTAMPPVLIVLASAIAVALVIAILRHFYNLVASRWYRTSLPKLANDPKVEAPTEQTAIKLLQEVLHVGSVNELHSTIQGTRALLLKKTPESASLFKIHDRSTETSLGIATLAYLPNRGIHGFFTPYHVWQHAINVAEEDLLLVNGHQKPNGEFTAIKMTDYCSRKPETMYGYDLVFFPLTKSIDVLKTAMGIKHVLNLAPGLLKRGFVTVLSPKVSDGVWRIQASTASDAKKTKDKLFMSATYYADYGDSGAAAIYNVANKTVLAGIHVGNCTNRAVANMPQLPKYNVLLYPQVFDTRRSYADVGEALGKTAGKAEMVEKHSETYSQDFDEIRERERAWLKDASDDYDVALDESESEYSYDDHQNAYVKTGRRRLKQRHAGASSENPPVVEEDPSKSEEPASNQVTQLPTGTPTTAEKTPGGGMDAGPTQSSNGTSYSPIDLTRRLQSVEESIAQLLKLVAVKVQVPRQKQERTAQPLPALKPEITPATLLPKNEVSSNPSPKASTVIAPQTLVPQPKGKASSRRRRGAAPRVEPPQTQPGAQQ